MLLKNRRRRRRRGVKGGGRRGKGREGAGPASPLGKESMSSARWLRWLTVLKQTLSRKMKGKLSVTRFRDSTLTWVSSNLSHSPIRTLDWLMGFGPIKSRLHSLACSCSLNTCTPITVMHSSSKYYCPSLQASPSLERSHTFCSSDVRLSLWLPSRSFKSPYSFTTISLPLCQPAVSQIEASLWAQPWSKDLDQSEPSLTQPGPAAQARRKVAEIWGRFVTVA